ncbi:MAG TPA: hypothetical protein VGO11_12290 [Chthoniobacteraceae bacterium]|jgi:hypothetical protein|nr:hypothetical protein [Chthoniobacteraceae bacterium]
MNEQQQRPEDPARRPCGGGGDDDANAKLEAAQQEAAGIYAVAKAHLAKVKSADSAAYLEQSRQRSGE